MPALTRGHFRCHAKRGGVAFLLLQGSSAVEKSNEAKRMATDVMEKSKEVCETSKRAIEIARKQRRAKEVATRATEKALRTFRWAWRFEIQLCNHGIEEKSPQCLFTPSCMS